MTIFELRDPNALDLVRQGFKRQPIMHDLGARLLSVAPGMVQIEMDFKNSLTQQHGFLHAGILTTLLDSACGFAAFSLMPPGSEVLSVEFKVNFLAPARGDRFIASGQVVKPGRTLFICQGEMTALTATARVSVALMQATMIRRTQDELPV